MAPAAAPRGLLGTRSAFALRPPPFLRPLVDGRHPPFFGGGRHAAVMIAGRIMFYVGVATAVTEMPVAVRPLARSLTVIASYFSRPRVARFDKHTRMHARGERSGRVTALAKCTRELDISHDFRGCLNEHLEYIRENIFVHYKDLMKRANVNEFIILLATLAKLRLKTHFCSVTFDGEVLAVI